VSLVLCGRARPRGLLRKLASPEVVLYGWRRVRGRGFSNVLLAPKCAQHGKMTKRGTPAKCPPGAFGPRRRRYRRRARKGNEVATKPKTWGRTARQRGRCGWRGWGATATLRLAPPPSRRLGGRAARSVLGEKDAMLVRGFAGEGAKKGCAACCSTRRRRCWPRFSTLCVCALQARARPPGPAPPPLAAGRGRARAPRPEKQLEGRSGGAGRRGAERALARAAPDRRGFSLPRAPPKKGTILLRVRVRVRAWRGGGACRAARPPRASQRPLRAAGRRRRRWARPRR
jgi:hypothetical protein